MRIGMLPVAIYDTRHQDQSQISQHFGVDHRTNQFVPAGKDLLSAMHNIGWINEKERLLNRIF